MGLLRCFPGRLIRLGRLLLRRLWSSNGLLRCLDWRGRWLGWCYRLLLGRLGRRRRCLRLLNRLRRRLRCHCRGRRLIRDRSALRIAKRIRWYLPRAADAHA